MTSENSEGVFARWSRLKIESRAQSQGNTASIDRVSQLPPDELNEAALAKGPLAEAEPAPILTDRDMPDLDTLDEDSDYSMFMNPGVSDALRKLALKKMFHAPLFNIRDGLDEYDEDFTSFEALGDIVTCDMKHQLELEAQKKLQAELESQTVPQPEIIDDIHSESPQTSLDAQVTESSSHSDDVTDLNSLTEPASKPVYDDNDKENYEKSTS